MIITAVRLNDISVFKRGLATLLFIIICLVFSSCKKEYTEWPYNNIEKFAVRDQTGQELKALIRNGDIIINWPPFQSIPDSVSPEIIVSGRASVFPASGTKIIFKEGLTYEVKAQDGSTKSYSLKFNISQPKPTYVVNKAVDGALRLGDELVLSGEYFLPDTAQTSLYLIDKNKKETKIILSRVLNSIIQGVVPTNIDTGIYHIRFKTGSYTLQNETLRITPPAFAASVNQASNTTVRKGGDLIIDLAELSMKYYAADIGYAIISKGFQEVRIEVSAAPDKNNGTVKFGIPADLSISQIDFIAIYNKKGERLAGFNRAKSIIMVID